jgi:tetratricopeptide (TPR) repeat protein
MNTKLYKRVHALATELLKAAEAEDQKVFDRHYEELKAICYDHESEVGVNGEQAKNHPVQWETLADFTEESSEALPLYEKALAYASDIEARDYMASITYSMARMLKDEGQLEQALEYAKEADKNASRTQDNELKREVKALLKVLL